jgi:predicted nucleic acid-binding protein
MINGVNTNNILADTSLLYEYFITTENTEKIEELFSKKKIFVSIDSLKELQTVLKNSTDSQMSYDIVKSIFTSKEYEIIEVNKIFTEQSLEYTLWHQSKYPKRNISFIDAIQIKIANDNKIALVTLDELMLKFPNCISLEQALFM